MDSALYLFLCVAVTFALGHCQTKRSNDGERARLPEFLTELDLASLEASEDDVEALKKVVKRLAPEKNGEYQVLQGVMGQPGIDFPVLTTIPTTTFSCRGLKGGYYADLETNCQVFHICDNGRKISFLCPNGTIFQQSQLICDWWFKVNCGKSAEFYEQSAEQLAEEERKRAETKKIRSEFHRAVDDNDQAYRRTEKSDYDGKQNGRTNPFGQTVPSNRVQSARQMSKQFGQNYIYNDQQPNERAEDQFTQAPNGGQETGRANHLSENYSEKQSSPSFNKYQPISSKQQNQLFANQNDKVNRFVGNYDQKSANKYQSTSQSAKEYRESAGLNQNPRRDDEQNFRNSTRSRISSRNNFDDQIQKVTPIYTETTTFRTTTANPIREYQQPAESAAFASSRGHRYNQAYGSNQFNNFYAYRVPSTENLQHESSTAYPEKERNDQTPIRHGGGIPTFPFPTFAPIYKPRTTTLATQKDSTTTQGSHVNTDDYGDRVTPQTTFSNLEIVTPVVYSNTQDLRGSGETSVPYDNTDSYQRNTVTPEPYDIGAWQNTENQFTQKPYVNTEIYRENTESTVTPVSVEAEDSVENDRGNAVSERNYERSNNGVVSTIRPYLSTESYQWNTATVNAVTELAERNNYGGSASGRRTIAHFENTQEQAIIGLETQTSNWDVEKRQRNDAPSSTRVPQQNSISPEQNWIGSSTEKSLSPYDTSFTYKQGKVISTLGPYVPFTKNYVYTTTTSTTTQKPPAYTATVPTYSSTISDLGKTERNLISKVKASSSSSFEAGPRESVTYLPAKITDTSKFFTGQPAFEKRPSTEQEHAINMLHSLQDLNVPSLSENNNGSSRLGLNIPNSSGPSTLHSLALYFATTSENFDSKENDTSVTVNVETRSDGKDATTTMENNSTTTRLPTSILTQNTVSSYKELFNLNNALESNVTTTENRFDENSTDQEDQNEDDKNDLDLQQSEGPIDGVKKSNNTKLRELAQVFTHALSAYLQDPDTFKKVLTEVRPTEPPSTISDELSDATTLYPMATGDYSSVTKEKDEVLDFSDVTKASKRRRPTTPFPTTIRPIPAGETTYQTYLSTTRDYYTARSQYSADTPANVDESLEQARRDYFEKSPQPTENTFAFEVNHAFGTVGNDIRDYNTGPDGPTGPIGPSGASNEYDNYFPTGSSSVTNRFNDVQTNATNIPGTYNRQYVKSFDAIQINDNYVASSTPASYVQTAISNENIQVLTSGRPRDDLVPPQFKNYNTVTIGPADYEKSTNFNTSPANPPESQRNEPVISTKRPFVINYYESTTTDRENDQESLVTASSLYPTYDNKYNIVDDSPRSSARPTTSTIVYQTSDPVVTTINQAETTIVRDDPVTTMQTSGNTIRYTNQPTVDHWTSSPTVTKLWETTVFLDPKQINRGLTSDPRVTQPTNFDRGTTFPSSQEILMTDASSGITSSNFNTDPPTTWQWTPNSNDSPTVFTLLPTAYSTDNTATPAPTYQTHSSITTTITSSVSSSSNVAPQKLLATINVTENEIAKAQEMFGNLNASSTNTLMKVMKQADNNATVRRLVLLLISHCDGPPVNKTEEQERGQLLNALLKMPVNEFSSEESREVVAGINKLNLSTGKSVIDEDSSASGQTRRPMPTAMAPVVTTYRNRKGRKFKATTDNPFALSRRSGEAEIAESNNSLSVEELTESDNRALELLRSLYTIAAKWG